MGADHAKVLSTAIAGAEVTAISDVESGRLKAILDVHPTARAMKDSLSLRERCLCGRGLGCLP